MTRNRHKEIHEHPQARFATDHDHGTEGLKAQPRNFRGVAHRDILPDANLRTLKLISRRTTLAPITGWRRLRRGRVGSARGWGIGSRSRGRSAALLAPEVVLVVAGVDVDPAILHFHHAGGQLVDEVAVVRNEHDGTVIFL